MDLCSLSLAPTYKSRHINDSSIDKHVAAPPIDHPRKAQTRVNSQPETWESSSNHRVSGPPLRTCSQESRLWKGSDLLNSCWSWICKGGLQRLAVVIVIKGPETPVNSMGMTALSRETYLFRLSSEDAAGFQQLPRSGWLNNPLQSCKSEMFSFSIW